MVCENGRQIIIVPAGCLGNREIYLQCKSLQESVYYQFSLVNRLDPLDMILSVKAEPSDEAVVIDRITVHGKTFKARINGGSMNTKSGIRFLVATRLNEEREFVATLPVVPAGIIASGSCGNYVIGDTGPKGDIGRAATVLVGKVLPTDPDGTPTVVNSGTAQDAVLDFTLPRGAAGPKGDQGDAATIAVGSVKTGAAGSVASVINTGDEHHSVLEFTLPQGIQGIQGVQGKAGTQILQSNRDPVLDDAKENVLWLNMVSGDWFESVPVGTDHYVWNKTGNLKGQAGNVIYSGSTDPVLNGVYHENDLYFNSVSSDVFVFNGNQWIKTAHLKGDTGQRGSLFFYNAEDPVSASLYHGGDCYLNNLTYDFFVFNGDNWQKVGNLKGVQGTIGPQGPQGLKGDQGLQGEAGKDGVQGVAGKNGTRIITSQKDPDVGSGVLNPDTVWINTVTWEVRRSIEQQGSWEWISLGTIKGGKGDQGIPGKMATIKIGKVNSGTVAAAINSGTENDVILDLVLPKGDKGDDGSRWYSGDSVPNATIGVNDPRGMPRPGDQYLYLNDTDKSESTYIYTNANQWAGPLATVYGPAGKAATVKIGTVQTIAAGHPAKVTNLGNENDAIFSFEIPKGDKGETGAQGVAGKAATIKIGAVITGEAGSQARVDNVGDDQNVILNLTLPKGMTGSVGPVGPQGATGPKGKDGLPIMVGENDPLGLPVEDDVHYWLNISSGDFFIYSNQDTNWVKAGNIRGPKGDKGDIGPQGNNGQNGNPGTGILSISQKADGTLVFTMTDGTVREVSAGHGQARPLPDGFTTNGGICLAPDDYVTGNKPMPKGLFLNGNLVMTDGSVLYQDTTDNGGVLCAA